MPARYDSNLPPLSTLLDVNIDSATLTQLRETLQQADITGTSFRDSMRDALADLLQIEQVFNRIRTSGQLALGQGGNFQSVGGVGGRRLRVEFPDSYNEEEGPLEGSNILTDFYYGSTVPGLFQRPLVRAALLGGALTGGLTGGGIYNQLLPNSTLRSLSITDTLKDLDIQIDTSVVTNAVAEGIEIGYRRLTGQTGANGLKSPEDLAREEARRYAPGGVTLYEDFPSLGLPAGGAGGAYGGIGGGINSLRAIYNSPYFRTIGDIPGDIRDYFNEKVLRRPGGTPGLGFKRLGTAATTLYDDVLTGVRPRFLSGFGYLTGAEVVGRGIYNSIFDEETYQLAGGEDAGAFSIIGAGLYTGSRDTLLNQPGVAQNRERGRAFYELLKAGRVGPGTIASSLFPNARGIFELLKAGRFDFLGPTAAEGATPYGPTIPQGFENLEGQESNRINLGAGISVRNIGTQDINTQLEQILQGLDPRARAVLERYAPLIERIPEGARQLSGSQVLRGVGEFVDPNQVGGFLGDLDELIERFENLEDIAGPDNPLSDLFKQLGIDTRDLVNDIEEYTDSSLNFWERLESEAGRYNRRIEGLAETARGMGDAFEDAFVRAIVEGENFREIFLDLLRQIQAEVLRFTVGQPINRFVQSLGSNLIGGIYGGGGGSVPGGGEINNPLPTQFEFYSGAQKGVSGGSSEPVVVFNIEAGVTEQRVREILPEVEARVKSNWSRSATTPFTEERYILKGE